MPDPKSFKSIKKKRSELNRKRQFFNQSVKETAEYDRYEQNRINGKQGLKNMLLYYRGLEHGDKELSSIIDNLDKLAEMGTTSDDSFWTEAVSYKNVLEQMNRYLNTLQKQEAALVTQSKEYLYKDGHWLTDGEIAEDENLQRIDRALNLKQNEIENKQFLISDLKVFLERQSTGLLAPEIPFNPKEKTGKGQLTQQDREKMEQIFAPGKAEDPNKNPYEPIKGAIPVVHAPSRHINGVGKMVDESDNRMFLHADIPLFPHEPCLNDITQGNLGDCFLLAPIAAIARSNPEKIKEMMHDNGDGTVTVRLYGRDAQGQYEPVYVTVDKVIEVSTMDVNNAEHCVWAACLERAVAISGLYANPKHSISGGYYPVPDNIDAVYQALKEKQDAGLLVGDALQKAVQAYPWVFTTDLLQNPVLKKWPFLDAINGGLPGQAAEILLGPGYTYVSSLIEDQRKKGVNEETIRNNAYDTIKYYTDRDLPAFAGSNRFGHLLVPGHAYTILNAYEKDGKRFVRLRNPWGTKTNPVISRLAEGVNFVDADNGIFDMEFNAFCEDFYIVQASGLGLDELRIDVPQPKTIKDSFELSDPDVILHGESYSNYLCLAPFASLAETTNSSRICRYYPDGNIYPLRKWAEVLSEEIQQDPNNQVQIDQDEFVADLTEFRNKLQEKLDGCFPAERGARTHNEIIEAVDKALEESRAELLEGGNEKYKGIRESVLNQIRDSNKEIGEQLKTGKLIGEKELDQFYNLIEKKCQNVPELELSFHNKFRTENMNDLTALKSVYRDKNTGIRMADYIGRKVPFRSLFRTADGVVFKDPRIEAGKGIVKPGEPLPPRPQANRVRLGNNLDYNSFMEYKKVLSDIDKTLAAEKGWFRKSSEESVALRKMLKDVQASIAGKCPIGFDTIRTELNRLTAPLDAYEAHCANNPRHFQRRENRLKACAILRGLQHSAQEMNPSPIEAVKRAYTIRLVTAACLEQKKVYTDEQTGVIADKMLQDAQFRGFINKQSVFHMQHATAKEIQKDWKAMTDKADKNILKTEKKAVEKITAAAPGNNL